MKQTKKRGKVTEFTDTERLNWIAFGGILKIKYKDGWLWGPHGWHIGNKGPFVSLRAAIDAAIRQQRGAKP